MPKPNKYKWTVTKGTNAQLPLASPFILYGVPYPIGTLDSVKLTVSSNGVKVFEKTVVGDTVIRLVPEDTDNLTPSATKYKYEVKLFTATNPIQEYPLINVSDFVLLETLDDDEVTP